MGAPNKPRLSVVPGGSDPRTVSDRIRHHQAEARALANELVNELDGALAKLGWLHPVAAEMFVGKFDPAHLRLADKLLTALPASPLHGIGAHDDRDWSAIRAWAVTLPALMTDGNADASGGGQRLSA